MALTLVVHVHKKVVQKLSSYCSNAVAPHQGSRSRTFAARFFYNSSFVHSQLLDSNYIQKLKAMCRYVKPNVLYSDVLKNLENVSRLNGIAKQLSNVLIKLQNVEKLMEAEA